MENIFSKRIQEIVNTKFGKDADSIYRRSNLLGYIEEKTHSVNRGSKSRGSFANLYAIYVLVEDYIAHSYHEKGDYASYEGALYSTLFARQRELPFGSKLQNHALNNRMNAEFLKYYPSSPHLPITRDLETKKYWINDNLLKIEIDNRCYNIAELIIEIIDEYIKAKQNAFGKFVRDCEELQKINLSDSSETIKFISNLLEPAVDARLFEIVSYSILKYYYHDKIIFWGYDKNKLNEEKLKLYKTGRTNANDGGIDFVMRPLGRFFQVTETLDFRKYFLDIDKIQKFPLTFVIKTTDDIQLLQTAIEANARKLYAIESIVKKYMNCIEEIINIPTLKQRLRIVADAGFVNNIINEIKEQSKTEFNYNDRDEVDEDDF